MNCRKVNSQLSAYIDAELPAGEMEAVQEHLVYCSACRLEHETLMQTKRAVASLSHRVSREEIARLLADAEAERGTVRPLPGKFSPVAATALLSLAGLWLATTTLDGPRDWRHPMAFPDYEPVASAVTPISMTPPDAGTVTFAAVSNPVTLYAVTPDRRIVGSTTVRQVRIYSNVAHPSLHDIVGRLFRRSGGRMMHPVSAGLVSVAPDSGMLNPMPVMRTLNERDALSYNDSLVENAVFSGRYSTAAPMQ